MRHEIPASDLQIGMVAEPLSSPLWPAARNFLHPALMSSDSSWDDLEPQLASDHAQLWAVAKGDDPDLRAAAVTRRVRARDGDVIEVFLVGGEGVREWIGPLNDLIGMAARADGCVGLRAYGRPGWKNILGNEGWRVSFVGYERSLA